MSNQILKEALSVFADEEWADGLRLLELHSARLVKSTDIPSDDLNNAWALAHESASCGNTDVAAALFGYCCPYMTTISVSDLKTMCMSGAAADALRICADASLDFGTRFVGTAYALNSLGRLDEFIVRNYSKIVQLIKNYLDASLAEGELIVQFVLLSRGLMVNPDVIDPGTNISHPIRAWLAYLKGAMRPADMLVELKGCEPDFSWLPALKAMHLIRRCIVSVEQLIELRTDSGANIGDFDSTYGIESSPHQDLCQLLDDLTDVDFHIQAQRLPELITQGPSSSSRDATSVEEAEFPINRFYSYAYTTVNDLFSQNVVTNVSNLERELKYHVNQFGYNSPLAICLRQLMVLALLKTGHTSRAGSEARLLLADGNQRNCLNYLLSMVQAFHRLSRRNLVWELPSTNASKDNRIDSLLVVEGLLRDIKEIEVSAPVGEGAFPVERLLPIVSIYRDIVNALRDSTVPAVVSRIGSACDELIRAKYRDREAIFRLRFTQALLLESLGRIEHAQRVLSYVHSRAQKLNLSANLESWARVSLVRVLLAMGRLEDANRLVDHVDLTGDDALVELYAKSLVLHRQGAITEAKLYSESFSNFKPDRDDYLVLRLAAYDDDDATEEVGAIMISPSLETN